MGDLFRAQLARAGKVHRCRRCGGEIDKGEYHAEITRRFYKQMRTDRAHYPICRPLDPDGVLVNGHIGQAVAAVVAQAAVAHKHGLRKMPRWLQENYDAYGDYSDYWSQDQDWIEEWDGAVQWGEAEYPCEDHLHVYGYKED